MSLISNPNHSEPSNRLQNRLGFCQAPHLRRYLIIPSHPLSPFLKMKIFYSKQNKDGTYCEYGMDNRGIASNYKTVKGFIRYGLPSHYQGHNVKLEVYYGDNTYKEPDETLFIQA